MSEHYDDASLFAALEAAAERPECAHETALKNEGVSIVCDLCDLKVALDAVAPLIAAKALRDARDHIFRSDGPYTLSYVWEWLGDRADEIERGRS